MNPALDNWDPMLEDFTSGKEYEEGPGANLAKPGCNKKEEESKIMMNKIPSNITVEGIRNLCLSAGIPSSVIINSNNCAVVTFNTVREAELAVRDLNDTPPYFMRVNFISQGVSKDCGNDETREEVTSEARWIDSFYKCPPIERHHLDKRLIARETINVSPYFKYFCEYDNPSLIMRLKNMDFKTNKECMSMGRGYINMGDLDCYRYEGSTFSVQSDNWNDSDCEITGCDRCGSVIIKNSEENYCSNQCETEAKAKIVHKSNSSIFDYFTPGIFGLLHCLKEDRDGLIKCCVVLDKESNSHKRLLECDAGEIIRAGKGDSVMARNSQGQFHRGVVCSDEGDFYRVALRDYGEIIPVETVFKSTDDLQDVPSFGGVAWFSAINIPTSSPVKFRVKERRVLGSWICDVINDNNDNVCEVLLEEWTFPECLTYVPLESGCSVVITMFKDTRTVFVRRTDGHWDEDFVRLSNDVAAYSLTAKTYAKLPKIDEVCSARYKKDGCFYRAVVRAVRRKSVVVLFMDYGNEQETALEDLRYLPKRISRVNCFAVRVRLKDAPRTSSPDSVNYLSHLTAYEKHLRLTFDDEEVVLMDESNNEVVSDVLSELVLPIWEKDSSVFLKSGEVYFLDSIDELEFHPGETEDIFVMNVNEEEFRASGTFWATQNRGDYLGHLNEELKRAITEYCGCLVDDPYLPRKGEICLVEFQGEWYRGVSLDDKSLPYTVFLIDFGITIRVETKQMRKILREFLEMPALALECRIPGFENFEEDKQEQMMEYVMKMNKKLLKGVDILRKVDGVYEVSIPRVQGFLGI